MCTRCVMDTSAVGISFDSQGVCNYCRDLSDKLAKYHVASPDALKKKRDGLIATVKGAGKNKKYDCIVGLSGGADSAYALYLAKSKGLRPLAVHMDNGWDSELAANNIHNLVEKLEVDLFTYVIDWEEYKALMQAFLDTDVIDVELLYDNAMLAVIYEQAKKYGIKYILSGTNTSTEGMAIPKNWKWFKWDKRNIYSLARKGGTKIKSFPAVGTLDFVRFMLTGYKWVNFLDYMDYNKAVCMQFLVDEYGYKPYPYKHYESVFTRFYQGYLLPEKFGVDKRRVHFSTLILTGQMTREAALEDLRSIPYPSEEQLVDDKEYFLKKMDWEPEQLEDYLKRPEVPHSAFPTEESLWNRLESIYKKFRKR